MAQKIAQRAVLAALTLHTQVGASAPDRSQAPTEPLALCLRLHTGRVVVDRLGETRSGSTRPQERLRKWLCGYGSSRRLARFSSVRRRSAWCKRTCGSSRRRSRSVRRMRRCLYSVQGIAHQRSGVVGHGARARSPFVGRARELALLQGVSTR